MKKSQQQLQLALAESLHATLNGLNELHSRKLQKMVAKAARKLAEKFTLLQGKERKAAKKQAEATIPLVGRKPQNRTRKRTTQMPDSSQLLVAVRPSPGKTSGATTRAAK